LIPRSYPPPAVTTLRSTLAATLPDYMVPAVFMWLEAFPRLSTGKVDHQALPAPHTIRPELATLFVAPRTPIEVELVRLWSAILGLAQVGIYDAFLELGGDSLLAMRLVARVQEIFQTPVPLRTLLQSCTVADMAVAITQHLASQLEPIEMA